MRLSSYGSFLLAAASASAASRYQSQQPVQVYLYPQPSDARSPPSAPTLTASQAKAVFSHHLGEEIDDFEEIPSDEGLWGHLLGMWRGQFGRGRIGAEEKARVVVIEGGVQPQDVLPTTLPSQPSFYLEGDSSTSSLLAPYLKQASNLLDHILDDLPAVLKGFRDAFELAGTRTAAALGHELDCFTAMADSVPWIENVKHSFSWDAISISGLGQVEKSDEIWEEGRKGVKAGLASMTQPDSPPLLLIFRPSTSTNMQARALPIGLRPAALRQESGESPACFSSNETCAESTTCNGRGVCVLKSQSTIGECWGCKCASGFAGATCEKGDYSMPFVLIIFSSVMLLVLVLGSVAMLYSVGETKLPSTLNLAIGGNMKRD